MVWVKNVVIPKGVDVFILVECKLTNCFNAVRDYHRFVLPFIFEQNGIFDLEALIGCFRGGSRCFIPAGRSCLFPGRGNAGSLLKNLVLVILALQQYGTRG